MIGLWLPPIGQAFGELIFQRKISKCVHESIFPFLFTLGWSTRSQYRSSTLSTPPTTVYARPRLEEDSSELCRFYLLLLPLLRLVHILFSHFLSLSTFLSPTSLHEPIPISHIQRGPFKERQECLLTVRNGRVTHASAVTEWAAVITVVCLATISSSWIAMKITLIAHCFLSSLSYSLDRPLTHINKKGRPVSQCPHCRGLRKSRTTHVKCECGDKKRDSHNHSNADSHALDKGDLKGRSPPLISVWHHQDFESISKYESL